MTTTEYRNNIVRNFTDEILLWTDVADFALIGFSFCFLLICSFDQVRWSKVAGYLSVFKVP